MKLNEVLANAFASEFEIARVEHTFTESGEKVAVLHLAKNLPSVTGSQKITDEASGEVIPVEAYDVDRVKVHESEMGDEGFDVHKDDQTGIISGKYAGNLRLDVAKNTGDVWLRSESFASAGRAMRQENRVKRQGGMLSKIRARQAAAKGVDQTSVVNKPTVVAQDANA